MSVVLLVMTDGRDCIVDAVESARVNLAGQIAHRVIHDDTGDPDHRRWLKARFPGFEVIGGSERQGFGGAVHNAWAYLRCRPERFVFHLEDDFIVDRGVDLTAMAAVLDRNPHLVQLALRRQPWNDEERAAGGIIEQHPGDYVDVTDGDNWWLEHRRFFTTNPSLYRLSQCSTHWPRGSLSEGRYTHQLLASPAVRFGFWGTRESGQWVTHIGHERVGTGY